MALSKGGPVKGDRDKPGETRIADMQKLLRKLALIDRQATGAFDAETEGALRRFQWYLVNRRWRLCGVPGGKWETALIEGYPVIPAITVSGLYDDATGAELQAWADGGLSPTTSLVRLKLANLANMERAPTYTRLSYPGQQTDEVPVSDGFVAGMEALNTAAGANKVVVRINHTFRVDGVALGGTLVPPAKKSQHYIGQAVDANYIDGKVVTTGAMMIAGKQSKAVSDFIAAGKAAGLRWGGDWRGKDCDPIHFDSEVSAKTEAFAMQFFFCQRAYKDRHPMRVA